MRRIRYALYRNERIAGPGRYVARALYKVSFVLPK